MTDDDVVVAHKHSTEHRAEIAASDLCGCLYCLAALKPDKVTEWTDDGETAICLRCGTDSVIGDKSGYPIDPRFLRSMRKHWFR